MTLDGVIHDVDEDARRHRSVRCLFDVRDVNARVVHIV